MPELPTGTVSFLFTELESANTRWEDFPAETKAAQTRYEDIIRQTVQANGGFVYKRIGPDCQSAFATAPGAIQAAVAAQRALQGEPVGLLGPLGVRMSIDTCMAEPRDGDYATAQLNRAARVMAVAHPGQILITHAAQQLAHGHLAAGVRLLDLGELRLRDLVHKERIFQVTASGLPRDFPPLATLEGHPNNLPAWSTPLVGREKEVEECVALMRRPESRLLTLTGPGGIGKTRLGLHIAAMLLEDFGDGVFLVGLDAISDPHLMPSAILHTLGVREAPGHSAMQSLHDYLRGKQMLLVLDNFEQVLEAAPSVWELLAQAPQIKILVTSRAALRLSAEQQYEVPPLSLPEPGVHGAQGLLQSEAVALFMARAQAVRPDFALNAENEAAVAELCQRLEGLPLAIELAAARITILTPRALLARLSNRLKLLSGGRRDVPARQQTMQATIGWSFDLLSDQEKTLFRRLAVCVGGCTLEAAEAVAKLDDDGAASLDTVDGLTSLADKSLLREMTGASGEGRFRMLELIREYALDRLVESGEEQAVRLRHAAFFLSLAEQAEDHYRRSDQRAWLDCLETERDNLRTALRWSIETKQTEWAMRFAGALFWFWYMRGHLNEGRAWFQDVLALPLGNTPPSVHARALTGAGYLAYHHGEYDTAKAWHQQSLDIAQAAGDRQRAAIALNDLGLIARVHGHYTEARELFQQSAAVNASLRNRPWEAISLYNLGKTIYELGDNAGARTTQERCLGIFSQIGDEWGIGMVTNDLGKIAFDQGDYVEARSLYEKSLAVQEKLGDQRGMALTLVALGRTSWNEGDYPRAQDYFAQGLSIFRQLGDRRGMATVIEGQANVALYQGDYTLARRLYNESLDIRKDMGYARGMASGLNNLGLVALREGDAAQARPALEQSVQLWRELGDKWGLARALNNLGRVAMNEGRLDEAIACLEESLRLGREVASKRSIAYSLSGLGQVAMQRGDVAKARQHFSKSLALLASQGVKWDIARVLLGMAWVASMEHDDAREVRLLAAADTLRAAIKAIWEPSVQRQFDQAMANIRPRCGQETFARAWQEGRAMSVAQAVDYALGKAGQGPLP